VWHARALPGRISWAWRLKRVFEIDQRCPNCGGGGGGELRIIAAILERVVIEKILTHLGLQARAPPRAPARGQALQGIPPDSARERRLSVALSTLNGSQRPSKTDSHAPRAVFGAPWGRKKGV
jgi:hypothetical protein